jgi:hypothetical protein
VGNDDQPINSRFVLRDLTFASRLVIACFLISVGVGYFAALIQLHFNGGAKAGEFLPGPTESSRTYAGERGPKLMSHLERLLEADENDPFNGQGQMRTAFTKKSKGWNGTIKKAKQEDEENQQGDKAVKKLLDEREGERLAMLEWIRAGGPDKAYKKDDFELSAVLKDRAITEEYDIREDGKPRRIKIKSLFNERCACCHAPDAGRMKEAEAYRLDSCDCIKQYVDVKQAGGMSLNKLAQTTHVHLLSFSMLYGLTGIIFTLTRYPGWFRVIFGPFALVMQLADVSCWWLARLASPYGEMFGQAIVVTGGLVAIGLLIQIIGTVFDLFDKKGKFVVLLLLMLGGVLGGYVKSQIIDPYLLSEMPAPQSQPEKSP